MKAFSSPLSVLLGGERSKQTKIGFGLRGGETSIVHGNLRTNFLNFGENSLFFSANYESYDHGLKSFSFGQGKIEVGPTLEKAKAGVVSRHVHKKRGISLFSIEYGAESDSLFESSRNSSFGANYVYAFPKRKVSRWILFVNYSNNRTFLNNIPLPAVGYIYNPEPGISMAFGVPFVFLNWIDFPYHMTSFALTPSQISLDTAHELTGYIRWFVAGSYTARSYLHVNRLDEDDRLYLREGQLELGLRGPLSKILSLQIGLGGSFEKRLYEAESAFSSGNDKLELDDELFVRALTTLRF
jgi:hypothetical protein